MGVYASCMCSAHRAQEKESIGSSELELQKVDNCHAGVGNWTLALWENSQLDS